MSLEAKRHSATAAANSRPQAAQSADDLRAYVVAHVGEAVERGYIRAYYQPVVRTLTGKLCGFEALARWEDPVHGVLSPGLFIGALEDARLIHKVDCEIIRQACRQHRACADAGEPVVPVSINLSRLDFDLCDIFAVIEEAVHEYEVPRGMLNIEITETVLGTDSAYMTGMVGKFKDVGYQVWMDDFGSGYSTLNVLKDFDFDELKIDMEFLNRFGDKSRTIIASVVDMAKKLGIQTLAEGVETEEHRKFLRRIGCEKMQGYLFGRPAPYSTELLRDLERRFGVERGSERRYFGAIGAVNTLSLSERDFSADNATQDYVTSMPLAIVEYDGERFSVLDANKVFKEGLANVGFASIEDAERAINDPHRSVAQASRRLMETIKDDVYVRQDYVVGGVACTMRAKFITERDGKTAVLISIDDTVNMSERKRHERMNEALDVLYTIYEHVDIIHLDEERFESVFSHAGYPPMLYGLPTIDEVIREFSRTEVFPADRERYLAFMNPHTMMDRIRESGEKYIVSFFRLRDHGGDFAWKLAGLIELPSSAGRQVMLCVRGTHWANDALFQEAFDGHADDGWRNLSEPDRRITDGSLWRALMGDDATCYFWKDANRRFIGANRAFLDYYGFESADAILGKNDEEMGWHVDPKPFMEDEMRVLGEGESTRDAPGKCIVKGEIRDIVASKRPVYRNGQVVGLVGSFVDVTEKRQAEEELERVPLIDAVTGALSYTGLESATAQFSNAFLKLGTDFGLVSIDIDSFKRMNDEFGYEFGDKVLKRVADEIRKVVGQSCVIGHVYADRFVVLSQTGSVDELQGICDRIERQLMAIARIDGVPCTVYAFSGFARRSEARDAEDLKRLCRTRLEARRAHERTS